MSNLQFTPIDLLPTENLTVVKFGVNRKWKIAALILAAVSLLLVIIATIVVFKKSEYSSTDAPIIITTEMKTNSMTRTTRDVTDENKEKPIITSTYLPNMNTFFPMSNRSETPVGLLLNHSLYFNLASLNLVQGYVINVTLRLFTNWEGDKPLYIFALKRMSRDSVEIMHRYPVIPERNNTQRQTIAIPFGEFPIDTGHFVGVGMQDRSDTNQICVANSVVSFYEFNITNNTRYITLKFVKFLQGVAFIYTTVRNEN